MLKYKQLKGLPCILPFLVKNSDKILAKSINQNITMSAIGLRNLYFFRNMLHGKVIISTESRVSVGDAILIQLMHRDSYQPFP
jgi:hypothetical protein